MFLFFRRIYYIFYLCSSFK